MILQVPVEHRAETKVRGRVKERIYEAVVTVEVPELDPADAPLAAWIPERSHGGTPSAWTAVRRHGEGFLTPTHAGPRAPVNEVAKPGQGPGWSRDTGRVAARSTGAGPQLLTAEGLRTRLGRDLPHEVRHGSAERTGTVLAEDPTVRAVLSDGLAAVSALVRAEAAEYVCVGGFAFRVVGHPVIEVGPEEYDPIAYAFSDKVKDPALCFAVTAFDEAVELLRSYKSRLPDARTLRRKAPDVVDASLLGMDLADWMARTVAGRVVHELSREGGSRGGGSEVSHRSRAEMLAFVGVRDALRGGASADDLVARMAELEAADADVDRILNLQRARRDHVMARLREVTAVDPGLLSAPVF